MLPTLLWKVWISNGDHSTVAVHDLRTGRVTSGRELTAEASELAERIQYLGAGRRIILCAKNSFRWLVQFLAIQKTGCAAVLLDADYGFSAALEEARRHGAVAMFYEEKLWRTGIRSKRMETSCVYKLTSGTSSAPRLIACSAAQLIADGRQIIQGMGIRALDRQLGLIPFGHSYGLGNLVMPLLLQGTPVWTGGEYTISQIPEWISRHRITIFPSVPSLLELLCSHPSARLASSLRLVISAGGPLPRQTAIRFLKKFRRRIRNFYGSSETGGIAYDAAGRLGLTGKAVGRALPGVKIKLAKGRRIQVSSPAVAMPGNTWILGDLGAWTSSGELQITGRRELLANIGGKKVFPREIARELERLKAVQACVVEVIQSGKHDSLAAWYSGRIRPEQIRATLAKRLPGWKIPRNLIQLKSLPFTGRGKVDREKLRSSLPGFPPSE